MKNLLIILMVLAPLWVRSEDQKTAKPPTAKEVARISKIESDFDSHFIQVISASSAGVSTVYWVFVKLTPDACFKAFPFSVPANANDQSVIRAIVSSMQTAMFYDLMIKKAAEHASTESHI